MPAQARSNDPIATCGWMKLISINLAAFQQQHFLSSDTNLLVVMLAIHYWQGHILHIGKKKIDSCTTQS